MCVAHTLALTHRPTQTDAHPPPPPIPPRLRYTEEHTHSRILTRSTARRYVWVQAAAEAEAAAKEAEAEAQGKQYRPGEGLPKDLVEAAKLLRRAVEQGNADAQRNLSRFKQVRFRSGVPALTP